MSSSPHLSRRQFLTLLSLGVGAAVPIPTFAQTPPPSIPIPPSLMLHSRESREGFMTGLMTGIREQGWQAITYLEYLRRVAAEESVENTVLISIDDIACTVDNLSFDYFVRMYDWVNEAGGKATFALITRPDLVQDDAKWDVVASWVENGFELATHTASHQTFNAPDTSQRLDFDAADFSRQIVDSAALIQEKLGERSIDYQVKTLITPFGSGWNRQTMAIHEGVQTACKAAGIKVVVGIVDGREPLPAADFTHDEAVLYVGRTPPGYVTQPDGTQTLTLQRTLYYLEHWAK